MRAAMASTFSADATSRLRAACDCSALKAVPLGRLSSSSAVMPSCSANASVCANDCGARRASAKPPAAVSAASRTVATSSVLSNLLSSRLPARASGARGSSGARSVRSASAARATAGLGCGGMPNSSSSPRTAGPSSTSSGARPGAPTSSASVRGVGVGLKFTRLNALPSGTLDTKLSKGTPPESAMRFGPATSSPSFTDLASKA